MPSLQRAGERQPSISNALEIEETDTDDAILNDILPRNSGKLAITSSLHPFWHTKQGGVVIGLVILTVIGAIVGGVVGASITRRSPQAASQASNGSTPSVTSTTFSNITGPSGTTMSISSAILPASRTSLVTTQDPLTSQHQPAAAASPSASPK